MTRTPKPSRPMVLVSRRFIVAAYVSFAAMVVCAAFLIRETLQLNQQQHRTEMIASENRIVVKALVELSCGIALNQANLDPRLLTILTRTLDQVHGSCPP